MTNPPFPSEAFRNMAQGCHAFLLRQYGAPIAPVRHDVHRMPRGRQITVDFCISTDQIGDFICHGMERYWQPAIANLASALPRNRAFGVLETPPNSGGEACAQFECVTSDDISVRIAACYYWQPIVDDDGDVTGQSDTPVVRCRVDVLTGDPA
jgi:hypothetical protein